MTSAAHLKSYDEIHAFLEQEFPTLRKRTDKLEIDFEKLFIRMERRFDYLERNMATKDELAKVYNLVDGLAKRFDEEEVERAAMKNQLNRHERWHHETAGHLGLKLD